MRLSEMKVMIPYEITDSATYGIYQNDFTTHVKFKCVGILMAEAHDTFVMVEDPFQRDWDWSIKIMKMKGDCCVGNVSLPKSIISDLPFKEVTNNETD